MTIFHYQGDRGTEVLLEGYNNGEVGIEIVNRYGDGVTVFISDDQAKELITKLSNYFNLPL